MPYIFYRCMRRLRQLIPLFLLIGCCLPLGCDSVGFVSVKLSDESGIYKVMCWSLQRGEQFAMIRCEEAEKAGKDLYEFPAFDGELMMVELSGKSGESKSVRSFPYIFRGDEKTPLSFSYQPGLVLLNGEVVCVNLGDFTQWRSGNRCKGLDPHGRVRHHYRSKQQK